MLFVYNRGTINSLTFKINKMKKNLILLILGMIFTAGAMAQTKDKDIKTDEKHLTNTIEDKRQNEREAGKDLTHLKVKSAWEKRKEIMARQRSIHRQDERLEARGVRHPFRKARHMANAEEEEKKAREDK
jgi:hypothetical protein